MKKTVEEVSKGVTVLFYENEILPEDGIEILASKLSGICAFIMEHEEFCNLMDQIKEKYKPMWRIAKEFKKSMPYPETPSGEYSLS